MYQKSHRKRNSIDLESFTASGSRPLCGARSRDGGELGPWSVKEELQKREPAVGRRELLALGCGPFGPHCCPGWEVAVEARTERNEARMEQDEGWGQCQLCVLDISR